MDVQTRQIRSDAHMKVIWTAQTDIRQLDVERVRLRRELQSPREEEKWRSALCVVLLIQ